MPEQPTQQPPPVQRVRIRYAKRGRMRFASHRDFSRAFERALMRARVPMAYSSGFNPHPRISYAGAAPTGAASEAEFVEVALARQTPPEDLLTAVQQAMPSDLVLLSAREASSGSLADGLEASDWQINLMETQAQVATLVSQYLATDTAPTERLTKRGLRQFDTRPAVLLLAGSEPGMRLVLVHQTPAVRPDDVLRALATLAEHSWLREPLLTRVSQGKWDPQQSQVEPPF